MSSSSSSLVGDILRKLRAGANADIEQDIREAKAAVQAEIARAQERLIMRLYKSWEDNPWDSVEEMLDHYRAELKQEGHLKGDNRE